MLREIQNYSLKKLENIKTIQKETQDKKVYQLQAPKPQERQALLKELLEEIEAREFSSQQGVEEVTDMLDQVSEAELESSEESADDECTSDDVVKKSSKKGLGESSVILSAMTSNV